MQIFASAGCNHVNKERVLLDNVRIIFPRTEVLRCGCVLALHYWQKEVFGDFRIEVVTASDLIKLQAQMPKKMANK
jgi:hypothetical protein